MDRKKVMLGIYLYYNTFSHLGVKNQHYPEHDTVYLSIFFPLIVYCFFPDQKKIRVALLSNGVEIPWINSHHLFGCHFEFAYGNQICLIQEVE